MVRTFPKVRLLPSLLDRLIDDDPLNNSLRVQKQTVQELETALAKLSREGNSTSQEANQNQQQLKAQLEQAREQLSDILATVAAASSLQEIRACVKRDLDWLFNTSQFSPQEQLDEYPDIARSVLNYGMPDLTGKTASGFDPVQMERLLKQVILNFEPRIIRKSLVVRVLADKTLFNHNALAFEIEGELAVEPLPLHLHLRTEFQLEDGNVSILDYQSTGQRS
ncbi:type VI secretion system baseplate subunit TssE [Crenothrix polyspora]|uniref:Type VI secretion system lysozyme-like protein n=1 Tax=Crenothrix polyspora TaxID=360316 RepID=A0A1R4HAB0_9GAMM|nr:type VI secretion system baseplate subunit TssE [Crenothrix polyspora]SJM93117.1 Type VI secretion system lysozyme-like protein [Crenothrix polyspora]